jgi:Ca-activated chloride channel family protein
MQAAVVARKRDVPKKDQKAKPVAVDSKVFAMISNSNGLSNPPKNVALAVSFGEEKTSRQPVFVVLLLDTSGSMAGEKLQAAKEGICDLMKTLKPTDLVMVITFNSEVKRLTPKPVPPKEVDVSSVQASGTTRLYDAILEAKFKKNADRRPLLVVLTDGEDTSGSSPDQARSRLSEPGVPNFQCLLLGVGSEAKRQLAALSPQKPNIKVESVDNSKEGIRSAFKYITQHVVHVSVVCK